MSTQEHGRHYYQHPNHSARERAIEATDFYMNAVHGVDPNANIRTVENSQIYSADDAFYRAKLREGFMDLRSTYQQSSQNQKALVPQQYQHGFYPSTQISQSNQPVLQPRSHAATVNNGPRPSSIHGTPGHPAFESSRNYDYETVTSRGSADSNTPIGYNAQSLYRCSSDLQVDNAGQNDSSLRRDFGSADLLEAKQMGYYHGGDADFFAMLRTYKSDDADQRAPAPPDIQNVLRGEMSRSDEHISTTRQPPNTHHPMQNSHATTATSSDGREPTHSRQGSLSTSNRAPHDPRESRDPPPSIQSTEFIKRSPKAHKKHRPRSGDVSALLRKLKPARGEGDGVTRPEDSGSEAQLSDLLTRVLPEERLRKKAFVHYDCQSVGISFVEAFQRRQSASHGNMKTGASAASDLNEMDDNPQVYINNANSPLVCDCPAFVNEIGGEKEKDISLSRSTKNRHFDVYSGNKSSLAQNTVETRPPICNGISILDGLPGGDNRQSLLEKHRGVYVLEYRDRGCMYYRQHFRHMDHHNYFGIDENVGPVAISIKREKIIPNSRLTDQANRCSQDQSAVDGKQSDHSPAYQYRVIVRTSELRVLRGVIIEEAIPTGSKLSNSSRGLPAKDIIDYVAPELHISSLKQAVNDEKTKDKLLDLDEQGRTDSYKVGIMYCKANQSTEEEMYNNEHASPAFIEFLDLIGRRVQLKGFDKFKGGLDNKTDTTGTHSYYTTCQAHEVMFHVSTLLPFENNRQQLLRKRHIGNDIVTVVFQEPGSLPFNVKSVRSHFQHVFIIVRVHDPNTDHTSYSVAVTRAKDVPSFGPPITHPQYRHGAEFADFLIAKILNAENAAHRSEKFQAMAVRTRGEYMKDLAENYVTSTSLEHSSKLGKFSINVGGGKKKDKRTGRIVPDVLCRGGVVWTTQVEDYGQSCNIDVYLVISADVLVVIEMETSEVVFTCWCSNVLGWTNNQSSDHNAIPGLKIYFNKGNCIYVKPIDQEDCIEIMDRLRVVTPGCETEDMLLRRNEIGQLGFHVHVEGLVSDVEMHGFAWEAGLRAGCRLVEICKITCATLTHEEMIELLRTTATVRVVVIPPFESGKPRCSRDDRSPDYHMSYPTDDRQRPPHYNIDGEESSAYFSDDENSPHSTVMSIAKRVNTVTLRSSSSGGSSCSPGSTLSGINKRYTTDKRGYGDYDDSRYRYPHSRTRSHDSRSGPHDNHYSDSDSMTEKRPPSGPVYNPNQGKNHYAPGTSYYNPSPENTVKPTNAVKRAPKDWKFNGPSPYRKANQNAVINERNHLDHYHPLSESQEFLANKNSHHPNPSSSNYSNVKEFGNLQRTYSDESLHSTNRRAFNAPGDYRYSPRRNSQEIGVAKPTIRGHVRSQSKPVNSSSRPHQPEQLHRPHQPDQSHRPHQPEQPHRPHQPEQPHRPHQPDSVDEDLDWNRLVNTASKAIDGNLSSSYPNAYMPWRNTEPAAVSWSHDSSTDRENSLLSGQSTPTQDKNRELENRCHRLEQELYNERQRSRDLERRLQREKNLNEDLKKELNQLKKDNNSLRTEAAKIKSNVNSFTENFFKAYDGPESAT